MSANPSQDFYAPTTAELHAAVARLTTLQLRRAFFAKLENPLWVAEFRKLKWFSNPPTIELLEDGSYRVDPWPEIDYLVRMAPQLPRPVALALNDAINTDNPWVRRGIWEAAARLPAAQIAPLVPKMKSWAGDGLGNSRTDFRDISRAIVILLEGGEHKRGVSLADTYYEPQPPAKESEFGLHEPSAGIDQYGYAETLSSVAAALGSGRLRILRRWLEKYQVASMSYDPRLQEDTSYIWRPTVAGGPLHHAREIGDSLVEVTRDAATESIARMPSSIETLIKSDQPLLHRIALYALANVLADEHQLARVDDSAMKRRHQLLTLAAKLSANETYLENAFRPEYVSLVKAAASWQSRVDLEPLWQMIEQGPPAIRDDRVTRFARDGDTEADTAARIEAYVETWQHGLLSAIGRDNLSDALTQRLAHLDAGRGVIEKPNEPAWQVHSFSGPISPLDVDQVKSMSDDQLLEQLRTWHPDPGNWAGPTHEGQGRVVTDALTAQPGRLADRGNEIQALRPTYARAILRGWQVAFETGGTLPWPEVIVICLWAFELNDEEVLASEGDDFDDDATFRHLKFQALQLLESGLGNGKTVARAISANDIPSVATGLTLLASHPEPEEDDAENESDPLTRSLNAIRPVALRALIRLVYRHPMLPAAASALDVLEAHIGSEDPSLAVAVTFGDGVGRLYDSAEAWTREHAVLMFGSQRASTPQQSVAFSTALAVHNYHPALLALLRAPMLHALQHLAEPGRQLGWVGMRTFDELVGDWILLAYISGSIQADDELFANWFNRADAGLRGNVLGHIGWLIRQWTEVSDDLLGRVKSLWDLRVEHVRGEPDAAAELSEFYWFVHSGKVDSDWWLPRLLEVVTLVPSFNSHGMLGDELAQASGRDPATALAVLEVLMADISATGQMSRFDLSENALPNVLAAAFDSGSQDLVLRADTLMNHLGAAGFGDLKERVDSRRRKE